MRIGIVHTAGSPCRCAEAVADGLRALGHEALFADSEEIGARAFELASSTDLVIDHTDTFRGRGLYRPLTRLLLEAQGARVVGSGSLALALADNKAATKARLAEAGIPTPPGVVISGKDDALPPWLTFPCVLKPASEHMSRGLHLARTGEEAREMLAGILERFGRPVVVETFIPGREIALSVLEGPDGPEVLPPLEWLIGGRGIFTQAYKLTEPGPKRDDAVRADLSASRLTELRSLAGRAFQTLGLRDYARFDVRLSPGGSAFFLEANATPSLEPVEALALSAGWAGLSYAALVERMLSSALRRYGAMPVREVREVRVDLPGGALLLEIPPGVHPPPASSVLLAGLLDVGEKESVLELGCGSGMLSIAAAKLGAGRVVATDVDPGALAATLRNARKNGVSRIVEVRPGSWYEPLKDGERFFEAAEYEDIEKGLFDYLLGLRSEKRSEFADAGGGKFVFRNQVIRASGVRV